MRQYARRRTGAWGWLLVGLVALAAGPGPGQDVFIGGRVDLELALGGRPTFDFGRTAGVDITFQQPGVLDAYLDLGIAGGDARIQEFYVSPPQLRKIVDLQAGRFLLPYGDPATDPRDRYVAGGRDLFDTWRRWRTGNVFLDTDLTGLALHRRFGLVEADLATGAGPDGGFSGLGRLLLHAGGARFGSSWFYGRDAQNSVLRQGALHAGWSGHGFSAQLQGFRGTATGGDHYGYLWRLDYTPPRLPLTASVAQTFYNDDALRYQLTTRCALGWQFDSRYRLEGRYEHYDSDTAPAGRFILEASAVF